MTEFKKQSTGRYQKATDDVENFTTASADNRDRRGDAQCPKWPKSIRVVDTKRRCRRRRRCQLMPASRHVEGDAVGNANRRGVGRREEVGCRT